VSRRSASVRAGLSVAGLLAVLVAASAVAQAPAFLGPPAPAAQRTHPSVTPRRGGHRTVFTVTFTARDATGTHDGSTWAYLVDAVRSGSTAQTTCTPAVTRSGGTAVAGQHVHVRLVAPRPWCSGHYRATVLLNRQIACGQSPSTVPVACPAIAFAPLDTGHATFVVG
jgi:hypothetical protein